MNSLSSLNKFCPRDSSYTESAPWRVVKHSEGLQYVATMMLNANSQTMEKSNLTFSHLKIRVNLGMSDAATALTNRVKQFFKALRTFDGCKHLDLSHCQLTDHTCRVHLAPMLMENNHLLTLKLTDNAFTDIGADVVFTSLIQSNVTNLAFARNAITVGSMDAAVNALRTDRFTSLDFSQTELGAAGLKAILPALAETTKLKSIALEEAKLGDEGCLELAKAFGLNQLSNIESLNLAENHIGRQGVENLCQHFTSQDPAKENLKALDLSKNYFGDQGFWMIIEMMKVNFTLTELKLSKVGITMPAFTSFCEKMNDRYSKPFGPYPGLQTFDIGGNGLGNDFHSMLTMLKNKNCTIQKLGFDGNEVTNFGAKIFTEWLIKFKGKRTQHEDKVAETESELIRSQTKFNNARRKNFLKLGLKSNLIDGDGCEYLMQVVNTGGSFCELDLRKNKIGITGAIFFKKAFRTFQCSKAHFDKDFKTFKFHILPADVGTEGVNHLAIGIREHPEQMRYWVKACSEQKSNTKYHTYARPAILVEKWSQAGDLSEIKKEQRAVEESKVREVIPGAQGLAVDIEDTPDDLIMEPVKAEEVKEALNKREQAVKNSARFHMATVATRYKEFDTPEKGSGFKYGIQIVGENDEKVNLWDYITSCTYTSAGVVENDRGVLKWDSDLYSTVKDKGWGCVVANTLYRYSLLLRMQYEAESTEFIEDLYLTRYRRGVELSYMQKMKTVAKENLISRLVADDIKAFWEVLMHQTSTKSEGLTMFEFVLKYAQSPLIDCLRQFLNVFPSTAYSHQNSKFPAVFLRQVIAHSGQSYQDLCLASTDKFVRRYAQAKKLVFFRFLEVEPVYLSKYIRVTKVEDLLLTEEYHDSERFFYMRRIANTDAANDENLSKNEFEGHLSFMDNTYSYMSSDKVTGMDDINNLILCNQNKSLDADFIPQISQLHHRKQLLMNDRLMPTFTVLYKTNLREVLDNESLAGGRDLVRAQIMLKMIGNSLLHFNDREWVNGYSGDAQSLVSSSRIHGSVKPRNIVMRESDELPNLDKGDGFMPGKWVLCDLSRSTKHGDDYFPAKDSAYNPPEVAKRHMSATERHLKTRIPANQKMDVWQFGCILFEVLSGTTLFKMEGNTDQIVDEEERAELVNWLSLDDERASLILNQLKANGRSYSNANISMSLNMYQGYDDEAIENCIKSGRQLVQWCLQGRPEDRPTFAEILAHPFLKDVDIGRKRLEIDADKFLPVPASGWDNIGFLESQPHIHLVNTEFEEAGIVVNSLEHSLTNAGCRLTTDSMRGQTPEEYEKNLRNNVESARVVACLLTSDAFFKPNVVKQLLFAEDYRRKFEKVHGRVLFIDLSAGVDLSRQGKTWNKAKFSKDYIKCDEFQYLVKALALENPSLSSFSVNNFAYDDRFDAWKTVLNTDFTAMILSYLQQPVKYAPQEFLKTPMLDRLLTEGHLVPTLKIDPFSVGEMIANNFRDGGNLQNRKLEERKQKFMSLYFLPANKVKKGGVRVYVLSASTGTDETYNAVSEITRALEAPSEHNIVDEADRHKEGTDPRNRLFNKVKTSYNIKKASHLKIGGRTNKLQSARDAVLNITREEGDLLVVLVCQEGVFKRYGSFLKDAVERRGDDFSLVLVKGPGFNPSSKTFKAEVEQHVPEHLQNMMLNKDNYIPYFKPKSDPWQAEASLDAIVKHSAHRIIHPTPKEAFVV